MVQIRIMVLLEVEAYSKRTGLYDALSNHIKKTLHILYILFKNRSGGVMTAEL